MHLVNQQQKLNQLCDLIRTEFTGTPEQLAVMLRITDRTLRRYLDQLRQLGADVRYSRTDQSYYFASSFKLQLGLQPMDIDHSPKPKARKEQVLEYA
jgi:predicted DNA-binding transcriptional regulator YafY